MGAAGRYVGLSIARIDIKLVQNRWKFRIKLHNFVPTIYILFSFARKPEKRLEALNKYLLDTSHLDENFHLKLESNLLTSSISISIL